MRPRIVEFIKSITGNDFLASLVPTGAILYVLAMLAVMWIVVKRSKTANLSTYHSLGACIWAMVGGLIGARLFNLIQNIEYTLSHPAVIFDLTGGTTSWGAYFSGFTAFIFYLFFKKEKVVPYLDILGSGLALGPLFGRWSCFLNSCCYGSVTDIPWSIQYPVSSYPYTAHIRMGLISTDSMLSFPVHPVQVYSFISALIIFIVVSNYWYRYRKYKGTTFTLYWLLYSLFRFGVEFFRDDVPRINFLQLTLAQYFCLIIGTISLLYIVYYFTQKNKMIIKE